MPKKSGIRVHTTFRTGFFFLIIAGLLFWMVNLPVFLDAATASNDDLPIIQATVLDFERSDWDGRYRIRFSWEQDGETMESWSRSVYSRETALRLYNAGYKNIRVSNSGNAIDINFSAVYAMGLGFIFSIIMVPIFALISLIYIPKSLKTSKQYKSVVKIMKLGKETTATFLSSEPDKHGFHKIRFSYKDLDGKEQVVWSRREYSYGAVVAVADMKKIPIKYHKNEAILIIAAVDKHLQDNAERLIG